MARRGGKQRLGIGGLAAVQQPNRSQPWWASGLQVSVGPGLTQAICSYTAPRGQRSVCVGFGNEIDDTDGWDDIFWSIVINRNRDVPLGWSNFQQQRGFPWDPIQVLWLEGFEDLFLIQVQARNAGAVAYECSATLNGYNFHEESLP